MAGPSQEHGERMSTDTDMRRGSASVCHRLRPGVKLGLAVGMLVAGVAIPVRYWPAYGVLGAAVLTAHTLARIPLGYLLRRVGLFLPFLLSMAVSLPLSQGFERGWDVGLQVLFRGTLAFLVSLWLVNVMPFEQLLLTLRRWHVPALPVAILAFMHRYVFVVWDELDSLRLAWRTRSFGRARLWHRWRTLSQMLGVLLIRSINRSERIHGAMLARGWTGEIRSLDAPES